MAFIQHKVFITGAGSGIGKACALHFINKGWFVAATDINLESLSYLSNDYSSQCFIAKMDVTNPQHVKDVFDRYALEQENLDVLVNNAGVLQMGLFENIRLEDHLKTIQVNFSGVTSCAYTALSLLKQSANSRIINISSSAAVHGMPEFSVYSATKNAVSALTEALNIELKKHGVYVCDIRPVFVDTPMLSDADYKAKSLTRMGASLSPDDVAEVVWQATQTNKLHWNVGAVQKALSFILAALPFAKHRIIASFMPS
ncbi:MAG: short-chain dehydrogenase [Gammaproteobacteria bacterium]|nr:MAG: short-chain dehydrogenase [Gammaproteobacteria bacterium]